MILSLIGMSNIGKSHWAKRLEEEQGFVRFSCDDLIAQTLSHLLSNVHMSNMDAFSAWMGMPYEFGYQERQQAYLSCEHTAMVQVQQLARSHEQIVIDTTGSFIYLSDQIIHTLRSISTIVYLETSDEQINEMTERFFQEPKPLIWGTAFEEHSEETHEQALRRCYPQLIKWRMGRYAALAHVSVPFTSHHDPLFTTEALFYEVLQHQKFQSSLNPS